VPIGAPPGSVVTDPVDIGEPALLVATAVVVVPVVAVGDACGGGELVPPVLHAETAAAVRIAVLIAANAIRRSSCRDTRAVLSSRAIVVF
jgi:hypothetical protein